MEIFHFTSETSLNASSALGCLFLSGWSFNAATNLHPNTNQVIRESNLRRSQAIQHNCLSELCAYPIGDSAYGSHPPLHPHRPTSKTIVQTQLSHTTRSVKVECSGRHTLRMRYQSTNTGISKAFRRWTQAENAAAAEQITSTRCAFESGTPPSLAMDLLAKRRETQRQKFEILSSCQLPTKCLLNRSKLYRLRLFADSPLCFALITRNF